MIKKIRKKFKDLAEPAGSLAIKLLDTIFEQREELKLLFSIDLYDEKCSLQISFMISWGGFLSKLS